MCKSTREVPQKGKQIFKIKVKVFSLCGNDTKGGEAGNLIEIWQKMMENWRLQSVKSWFQVSKEIQ